MTSPNARISRELKPMISNRVTEKDLQNIVDRINALTGADFILNYAYGGVELRHKGGSVSTFNVGYVSKPELKRLMFAFIEGLRYERI